MRYISICDIQRAFFLCIMNERLKIVLSVYPTCYNHLCQSTHTYTYNYLSVNIETLYAVKVFTVPVFWGPDQHLHFHLGHCKDAP